LIFSRFRLPVSCFPIPDIHRYFNPINFNLSFYILKTNPLSHPYYPTTIPGALSLISFTRDDTRFFSFPVSGFLFPVSLSPIYIDISIRSFYIFHFTFYILKTHPPSHPYDPNTMPGDLSLISFTRDDRNSRTDFNDLFPFPLSGFRFPYSLFPKKRKPSTRKIGQKASKIFYLKKVLLNHDRFTGNQCQK